MKIIDGLKLKGRPAEIPDCGRASLPQFFKDMKFKVGAEIGVEYGFFSEELCKAGMKVYAIDPWLKYGDYRNNRVPQDKMDSWYECAVNRLKPYDCVILRKKSMDATEDIPDESLDFVYIDGNHDFKHVAEDIVEWSKKVRKGGVISGHDYIHIERTFDNVHVKWVVDAYTQAFKIRNWYLLGRKEKIEGEVRDKQRSWMWIK